MKMTDETFAILQDYSNLCDCCDDYHDAIIRLAGDNVECSVRTLLDSYRQLVIEREHMFQDEIKPLGYRDSFDAYTAYVREQSVRNLR